MVKIESLGGLGATKVGFVKEADQIIRELEQRIATVGNRTFILNPNDIQAFKSGGKQFIEVKPFKSMKKRNKRVKFWDDYLMRIN